MRKNIHENFDAVIDDESGAPEQVPLHEYAPSIYDVATLSNGAVERLVAMLSVIATLAEFNHVDERLNLAGKLIQIGSLADIARNLGDDDHNEHDCLIAACMLASDDPEIRKAAQP